ncbi:NgoFVII restriction endonuclease [compost metagenome]
MSKEITRSEGYPEKNKAFFVLTDDGYWFKAHTTSDGNKQFSAVGDELILGRWIKGRLAAAGLVTPVNDTQADLDRQGMITKEMLDTYGSDSLVLSKTEQTALDDDGSELDVWTLSF